MKEKFYCLDCPKEVSGVNRRCNSCATKKSSWNRGKTKETDERVKKNGKNILKARKENGSYGKLSYFIRKKISKTLTGRKE